MKKIVQVIILVAIIFPFFPQAIVNAADINVSIDITYSVNAQGIMHIKETRTVTNSSTRFYIPSQSEETFIISAFKTRSEIQKEDLEKVAQTIQLTDLSGVNLNPSIAILEEKIEANVNFGRDIYQNQTKTFVLEYDNFELAEKSGNIWNIYVPGLPEDYNQLVASDKGATTKTNYGIYLEIESSLGTPNFVLPTPRDSYDVGGKKHYVFDPASLVKQTVWLQIGSKQYYAFTITQAVESSTDLGSKIFNTWYDLILPRESESGNQKVYFKSITPEPMYVRKDGEGNIIARFSFDSAKKTSITVKGYITSNISEQISENEVGNVSDIDPSKFYARIGDKDLTLKDLLSAEQYWEVTSADIQKAAAEVKQDLTNAHRILFADYNFVTQKVDYDNLKIGINNQRQGALKTLNGESSVCMEYADLLITLLRAQGIPSRACFGYGFDPKSERETEEGHQWLEAYLPNVGWVAVDPTWGDTGRKSYIGGDVDHALWYVAGSDVEIPSPVTKYSFSDTEDVEAPKFEIQAVETINLESLTTLEELLDQYKYTPRHFVYEQLDRLNIYGKIVFVVVPAIILILLIFTLFLSLAKIIKRITSKNIVIAKPADHDVPNNPYY